MRSKKLRSLSISTWNWSTYLREPLRTGATFALLTVLVLVAILLVRLYVHPKSRNLTRPGSTFKFTESWATNLAFVAAVGTALLASTDLVNNILPNPEDRYVILAGAIVWAGLVGAGPLIFNAGTSIEKKAAALVAFCLAALATLTAAFAELTQLAQIVSGSSVGSDVKTLLHAMLIVAGTAMALYAVITAQALFAAKPAATATRIEAEIGAVGSSLDLKVAGDAPAAGDAAEPDAGAPVELAQGAGTL